MLSVLRIPFSTLFLLLWVFPVPVYAAETIRFVNSTTSASAKNVFSITVPVPAGYQPGDVMIATMQSDYGQMPRPGAGSVPAAWAVINITDTNSQYNNYDLSTRAYYHVVTGTEPSSYTWNMYQPDATLGIAGGTISLFRGVDTANPIYSWGVNVETSGQFNQDCPSVEAPVGGMLVCQFTHDDPPRICINSSGDCAGTGANTGLTEISFWRIPVDPNHGFDDSHETSYQIRSVAGQTGTRRAYLKDSRKDGNDHTLAFVLRPASGSITPTATPTPGSGCIPVVTPPGGWKTGDANDSGTVDGIDYTIWLLHYLQSTTQGYMVGDFSKDCRVDGLDYVLWLGGYGG